jgi:hypothetical protein
MGRASAIAVARNRNAAKRERSALGGRNIAPARQTTRKIENGTDEMRTDAARVKSQRISQT